MISLVLEGGGARGAYQAGVVRTLLSNGYEFKAVTGTSIGALNGVMLAQNSFEKSYELWETMEFNKLFDFKSKYAENLSSSKFDMETIKYLAQKLGQAVSNKGLSTDKIRGIISTYIDEDKLRTSGIDFGIMTVSLNELKPYEIFLEDIPYGLVADYVMASANFPGFSKLQIGDKVFIDGGLYDNLPINMMISRGHTDILAIETKSILPKRKVKIINQAQVYIIKPSEKPGRMLDFNPEPVAKAMKIGHYDAMRYLRGYVGELYYLELAEVTSFGYGFNDLDYSNVSAIAYLYGYKLKVSADKMPLKSDYEQYIVDYINKRDKKKYKHFASAILHIFEKNAYYLALERLTIYKFNEFIDLLNVKVEETNYDGGDKNFQDYKIINNIYKWIRR